MNHWSMIDKFKPKFIALTMITLHNCLWAWKRGEFRVLLVLGSEGGAQPESGTRNINHMLNNGCTDVFRCLRENFCFSLLQDEADNIETMCNIIYQRIHSTGIDRIKWQPHNYQGSMNNNCFDYVPDKLIEQPNTSFYHLSSFVAATADSMQFSTVLPMGGCAFASSCQPYPGCNSNSNSNSNDITTISNITSIRSTSSVDGSMIVKSVMWHWD